MNVFSFSIYGNNPIYTIGGIKNAELVKKLFPEWNSIFYVSDDVNPNIVDQIKNNGGIIKSKDHRQNPIGTFWRFEAILEPEVDIMIVRDCDSRISERDVAAINEFVDSDKLFHIIRDHPTGHWWVMNAGMWGCKNNDFISELSLKMNDFMTHNPIVGTSDQLFLANKIYPYITDYTLIHDEYFKYESHAKPIKHDRKSNNFAFIGESIDENDVPRGDQRSAIIKIYNDTHI